MTNPLPEYLNPAIFRNAVAVPQVKTCGNNENRWIEVWWDNIIDPEPIASLTDVEALQLAKRLLYAVQGRS